MNSLVQQALESFLGAVEASSGYVDEDFWKAYIEGCEVLSRPSMERPE